MRQRLVSEREDIAPRGAGLLCLMVGLLLTGAAAAHSEYGTERRYEITRITYHIEGRTRQFALENVVDLETGLVFFSRGDLDDFIADQQQLLLNQRPLAEARVEHEVVEVAPERFTVLVDVYTRDSWNIIALPFFRYSSDDGMLPSMRARDYNFFGTLERLAVNLDWRNENPDDGVFDVDELNLNWTFTWPFQWHGYDWRWRVRGELAYFPDDTNEYSFETSLSITFPWLWNLDWTATYVQGLDFRRGDDLDSSGLPPDDFWLTPGAQLGTSVATGWTAGFLGEVDYNPGVGIQAPMAPGLSTPRRGPVVQFDHSLDAGRVDWIANFRHGNAASVSNLNRLNLYRAVSDSELNALSRSLEANYRAYRTYLTESLFPIGLSARTGAFAQLDGTRQINDRVRGIIRRVDGEDRLRGEYGLYANTDFAVSAFRWGGFLEGQGALFLDVGVTGMYGDGLFDPDDILFGGGIELFAFPLFSRAFYVRASLGFDLRAVVEDASFRGGNKRDIFIGLDHHY